MSYNLNFVVGFSLCFSKGFGCVIKSRRCLLEFVLSTILETIKLNLKEHKAFEVFIQKYLKM